MGNQTTVTVVAFGGAGAAIIMWILGFFAPDFMGAAPAGAEAAITTILIGVLGFVGPWDGIPRTEIK